MSEEQDRDIVGLYGTAQFPVAMANMGDPPAPFAFPKMFYVWVFDPGADNYIPIAACNTRENAELYFASVKDFCKSQGVQCSGGILELSWPDFMHRAVEAHLKDLAKVLMPLLPNKEKSL